jgi:tetratricopeptide (TPR) repeat protein/CHAT domain-containing protein
MRTRLAAALLAALLAPGVVAAAAAPAQPDAAIAAGQAAYARRDFARAIGFWQAVLPRLSPSDRRRGDVFYFISLSYFELDEFAKSIAAVRQALPIHRALKLRAAEAADLDTLGNGLYDLGKYAESLDAHRQSLAIDRDIGNATGIAANLGNVGIILDDLGMYADAVAADTQAFEMERKLGDQLAQAQTLTNLGSVQFRLGRYDDALATFARASALAKRIKAVTIEADTLQNVGLILLERGRFRESLDSAQQALALFRAAKDRLSEAGVLTNIGLTEEKLGRYADALAVDERALALHRALGNRLGEANALTNAGMVEQDLGKYAEALTSHRNALDIHRAIGNRAGEAADLTNIGTVDEHLARYDDALAAFREVLSIARAIGSKAGEVNALVDVGEVDSRLGRYSEAFDTEQQALVMARALQNRAGEQLALANLATVDYYLGNYDDALNSYRESLDIARAAGDRRGEADGLTNLANVEVKLGQFALGLDTYRKALAIYRDIGNRLGEAAALDDAGEALYQLDRFAEALAAHDRALTIDREIGNRLGEADNLGSIGNSQARLGNYAAALVAERQALALQRAIGNAVGQANNLASLASAQEALGDYAGARENALAGAALATQLADPDDLWRARTIEARAEAALDDRAAALAAYDAALDTIEGLRAGLSGGERGTYFSDKLFAYDEYAAYLRDLDRRFPGQGYGLKALEVFERKSARAALEQIGSSAARHFAGVDPQAVAEEDAAAAALDAAGARLRSLLSNAASADADLAAAREALAAAKTRLATVAAGMKARYPAYYELRHPQPLIATCAAAPCATTFEAFRQSVLLPGEVVLIYDLLEDGSLLWVVDKDAVRLVTLPRSKDIDAAVNRLEAHVAGIGSLQGAGLRGREKLERAAAADLPGYAADSYALYRMLVPPEAAAAIARARGVVIVPTGSLYRLAFESLVTGDPAAAARPHYLIEDVALSYVPSASLLAVVRAAYAHPPGSRAPLLAFANPTFGAAPKAEANGARGVDVAGLQLEAVRSSFAASVAPGVADAVFPALPGTQTEADAVRAALGAPAASIVDGDAASRARLLDLNAAQSLKTYRYLLFATHAVLPSEIRGLTQPAIVLAHPERGDGLLTMADVFGLSLDADFVTLSACNTGVETAATNGDGISGLTRAFLYAGTPAISVTLWQVDDAAAPQITPRFFSGMSAAGLSPAEALRRAKLALLQSPEARFRHPYAWAPGVIFGDGDRTR